MNRRELLASAVAAVLPVSAVATVGVDPAQPEAERTSVRMFLRYDRPSDKWEPVSGFDVKPGDVIRDPNTGLIVRVIRNDPDNRHFHIDVEIDPKTNQWVPCGVR